MPPILRNIRQNGRRQAFRRERLGECAQSFEQSAQLLVLLASTSVARDDCLEVASFFRRGLAVEDRMHELELSEAIHGRAFQAEAGR